MHHFIKILLVPHNFSKIHFVYSAYIVTVLKYEVLELSLI